MGFAYSLFSAHHSPEIGRSVVDRELREDGAILIAFELHPARVDVVLIRQEHARLVDADYVWEYFDWQIHPWLWMNEDLTLFSHTESLVFRKYMLQMICTESRKVFRIFCFFSTFLRTWCNLHVLFLAKLSTSPKQFHFDALWDITFESITGGVVDEVLFGDCTRNVTSRFFEVQLN